MIRQTLICIINMSEFEKLWNARLPMPGSLVRLTNAHELLPEDLRGRWWLATCSSETKDIEREALLREMPRPALIRQTNLHHVLPMDLKAQWLTATAEERALIEQHYLDMRDLQ